MLNFICFGAFGAYALGLAISICRLEVHLGGERFQKNVRPPKKFPPKFMGFSNFGDFENTFFPVGLEGYNFNPR